MPFGVMDHDTIDQQRLEKHVAIARSGVQYYLPREVAAMGVTIPKESEGKRLYGVYRPATLLAAKKDLFGGQPFINTHKGFVDPKNYTKYAQGWTSDSVEVEMNAAGTEAIIKSDLKILGEEAIKAYESGVRQVSPHYGGAYDWEPGTSPDGKEFDIIMRDITWVNHVALVPRGRGGADASIEDAAPTNPLSWIWHQITKKFAKKGETVDEELPTFRQRLTELAKLRDTLSETEMEDRASELYKCISLMPMSEDVDLLYRYLGDLKLIVGRSQEEADEYVRVVADKYEEADSKSIKEIMNEQEQTVKGQEDAMTEEEKKAAEEKAAKDKAAKDAEENKELEGLMAKVKDHMASGGKASDFKVTAKAADDEPSEEEKKKKAEEEKAAKDKAAKDAEETEAEKKKEEEKKGAEDHAAPLAGVYDSMAFLPASAARIRDASRSSSAVNLLGRVGYLPNKEKK